MATNPEQTTASPATGTEPAEVTLGEEAVGGLRGESAIGIGPLEDMAAELEAETTAEEAAPPVGVAPAPSAESIPPAPPAEAPPAIDPRIQQELDTLRQQSLRDREQLRRSESQALEQENRSAFQAAVTARQAELEDQEGITPERANAIAQREIGMAWRTYQAELAVSRAETQAEAKIRVAAHYAEQYKVPVVELMSYNTPTAMQKAAETMTAASKTEARLAALEAENIALKKSKVPAQNFMSGTGSGGTRGNSREAIRDRYVEGASLTPQEKAILYPDR